MLVLPAVVAEMVAAVAAEATGAGTEIAARVVVLPGSVPLSVWVLQSRLPVFE